MLKRRGMFGVFMLALFFLWGEAALIPLRALAVESGDREILKSQKTKTRGPDVRKAVLRKAHRKNRIFAAGNGSQRHPWVLRTVAQLEAFARSVNQGNAYSGKRIRLAADLDLGGKVWTPIGFYRNGVRRPFKGTFDGNGHALRGLRIDAPAADMAGLFGVLEGASVQNLRIEDVSISGGANLGAVAGLAVQTELRNCSVSGSVLGGESTGGLIGKASECRLRGVGFSGTVKSSASGVGGLVGSMFGTLLMDADVRGEILGVDNVGGLVGSMCEGEVRQVGTHDLEVKGRKEVGGLVGFLSDMGGLRESCFKGAVSGKDNTGGLAGWVESGRVIGCSVSGHVLGWERTGGISGQWGQGMVRRCSVDASISGTLDVGGLVGRMEKGAAEGCEIQGYVEGGDAVGGLVGSLKAGTFERCVVLGGVKGSLSSGREIGRTVR